MYFVFATANISTRRGNRFPRFLRGELPAFCPANCRARPTGWTICRPPFPRSGLKAYLEMRGADGGPWNRICALPALCGSGCSMIRARLMPPGIWSRAGALPSNRRCATPSRAKGCARLRPAAAAVGDLAKRVLDIAQHGPDRAGRGQCRWATPKWAFLSRCAEIVSRAGCRLRMTCSNVMKAPWGGSLDPDL